MVDKTYLTTSEIISVRYFSLSVRKLHHHWDIFHRQYCFSLLGDFLHHPWDILHCQWNIPHSQPNSNVLFDVFQIPTIINKVAGKVSLLVSVSFTNFQSKVKKYYTTDYTTDYNLSCNIFLTTDWKKVKDTSQGEWYSFSLLQRICYATYRLHNLCFNFIRFATILV